MSDYNTKSTFVDELIKLLKYLSSAMWVQIIFFITLAIGFFLFLFAPMIYDTIQTSERSRESSAISQQADLLQKKQE
jgi:uncharacterized protein with PQ loop repeat